MLKSLRSTHFIDKKAEVQGDELTSQDQQSYLDKDSGFQLLSLPSNHSNCRYTSGPRAWPRAGASWLCAQSLALLTMIRLNNITTDLLGQKLSNIGTYIWFRLNCIILINAAQASLRSQFPCEEQHSVFVKNIDLSQTA